MRVTRALVTGLLAAAAVAVFLGSFAFALNTGGLIIGGGIWICSVVGTIVAIVAYANGRWGA